jgi:uncharacterized protein (TIGR02996 family)
MLAIVAKAIFEKAAGKAPRLGARLAMDRYVSTNKALAPLGQGGKLYLVTVRPPNDALWLVGVLDRPHFDGKQWIAQPSDAPITDITTLRDRIRFASGQGISAEPGRLGMSLQTPRVLADDDGALLETVLAGKSPGPARGALAGGAPPPPEHAVPGDVDRVAGLLAAVLADPEGDFARQVYADELVSRNDPRGELVHVDLALAGKLSIRKRDLLGARRGVLMKQHAATWWPYAVRYRVRGGFIEAVDGPFAKLDGEAARLFAAEPVVEVTVHGVGSGNAGKLAKAPWLPRVRRLVVRGNLGDEGFATLVAARGAQTLRALNVTANELTGEALDNLEDHLPACTTLVLTANAIGDEGIAGLRAWSHLDRLEALYLSQCELSPDGVAELLSAPLPKLAKLTLSGNDLDDAAAATIAARAKHLPALRVLELKATGLSSVEALARLPLTRLDVRRNDDLELAGDFPHVRTGR